MEALRIEGGASLRGQVQVSGSKNACLPLFVAALMTPEKCVFRNVPDLSDVRYMAQIIEALGAKISNPEKGVWEIQASEISNVAPYDLVRKMRASICLLGPLVARKRSAKVSMPGGCVIGARPIDLHIKGLKALRCKVSIESGYVNVDASKMRGNTVFLGGRFGSTVTGTANMIMAAVCAPGETVIESAACEPEIADLCNMLQSMGAIIDGIGSPTLKIIGVPRLCGTEHTVIADRIEAGTWIIATLATKGKVVVKGIVKEHLSALLDLLEPCNAKFEWRKNDLHIDATNADLKPISAVTMPYPGFPTDLQAQICALCTQIGGNSIITEKIYPERFMHVAELLRMGADIAREGASAIVHGPSRLSGADVMASDLRASAALLIAALCAKGETVIHRIYHLDRGYDSIDKKLAQLGAKVCRFNDI